MKRQLVSLGIAISVTAILLVVAIVKPGTTPTTFGKVSEKLPDSVQTIRLTRPDKPDVVLQKMAGSWQLQAPLASPANASRARALASLAAATIIRSYHVDEHSLKAIALSPPRFHIQLDDLELALGAVEPVDKLRYLRVGDQVHLVPNEITHHLSATPEGFVDPTLLAGQERIQTLRLPTVTISSTGETLSWEPEDAFNSADQAAEIIARWQRASAFLVEPLNLALRWSRPVTITTRDGTHLKFLIARNKTTLFLGRRDTKIQYRIGAETGLQLLGATPIKRQPRGG